MKCDMVVLVNGSIPQSAMIVSAYPGMSYGFFFFSSSSSSTTSSLCSSPSFASSHHNLLWFQNKYFQIQLIHTNTIYIYILYYLYNIWYILYILEVIFHILEIPYSLHIQFLFLAMTSVPGRAWRGWCAAPTPRRGAAGFSRKAIMISMGKLGKLLWWWRFYGDVYHSFHGKNHYFYGDFMVMFTKFYGRVYQRLWFLLLYWFPVFRFSQEKRNPLRDTPHPRSSKSWMTMTIVTVLKQPWWLVAGGVPFSDTSICIYWLVESGDSYSFFVYRQNLSQWGVNQETFEPLKYPG